MRVVLADVRPPEDQIHKDVWLAGFGSPVRGLSLIPRVASSAARLPPGTPSPTLATLAAILAREGHEVRLSQGEPVDAEIGLALSSRADHQSEAAWAETQRARGSRVGFVGPAVADATERFEPHADFLIYGEPEEAVMRLARGQELAGRCASQELVDLTALPFPRWDLLGVRRDATALLAVVAGRGCPEPCVGCPHRLLVSPRLRPIESVVEELAQLARSHPKATALLLEPGFGEDRDRVEALVSGMRAARIDLPLECEARLERLETGVLELLRGVGLRAVRFPAGRPASEGLAEAVRACRRLGVRTLGRFVLGREHDTWASVTAGIEEAVALSPTLAQFHPATPASPDTVQNAHLGPAELQLLLVAAYDRFYLRPSFLLPGWRGSPGWRRGLVERLDRTAQTLHARKVEAARTGRMREGRA